MKLKQKELFIERKHQELDLREEKFIKELDRLSKSEQILCAILTAEQTPSLEGSETFEFIRQSNKNFFFNLQAKIYSKESNVSLIICKLWKISKFEGETKQTKI